MAFLRLIKAFSISREPLIVGWLAPHFNRNVYISINVAKLHTSQKENVLKNSKLDQLVPVKVY